MASLTDAGVKELLNGRYIASMATEGQDGSLHIVAVWYSFDGSHLFVATSSRTRKARNLQSNSKVALMIDARDPAASRGVTVVGTGETITGETSKHLNLQIHRKYLSEAALADAKVGPVFAGWDDVTIRIVPRSVIAWDMREADKQVFGSAFAKNPTYLRALDQ